ncbi:MAG: hypothetical protein BZY88_07330 [SAR202 cluster bacterium Io17-Chloro-G9]|nr:MAG: hypothetical protein BZY88_07330 [SAR202 cluster bacterium Io17-Chloro-G9]
MSQPRLYSDLAYLWPLISPREDYEEAAMVWLQSIWDKLGEGRHRVLELGVGGGHHLSHLTGDLHATAVDISPQMLELSQRLNPGVEHHLGDMRTLRLGEIFDAVLVHDAICCMLTEGDLAATFETAKIHLRPGGLLILAPDWVRENFRSPMVFHWIRGGDDIQITVQEYLHDPDPTDTQIESVYTYTIVEDGRERVEQDTHTTGLFPMATWTGLLDQAGFSAETAPLPDNQGAYGGFLFVAELRSD